MQDPLDEPRRAPTEVDLTEDDPTVADSSDPVETSTGDAAPAAGTVSVSTWAATRAVLYQHRHKIVLAAMVWLWWWTFYRLGALRQDRFGTFGFDLGIFDQAAWLVAHFKDPFMTVRGLDVWGHHGNFIFYLFAPFYWLGGGPKFLLAAQLAAQLAGVVGVYLLARDRLDGNRWFGVLLGASMMLHPTMGFLGWEYFHPETFAIGPIILAYWAARTDRWRVFWAMAVLAMMCKEDITLVFVMLGVIMMMRKQVRIGATIAGVAAGWYLFVTKLIIPWRNPAGPFYEEHFFANYGGSMGSVIKTILRHPTRLWRDLNEQGRVDFYMRMWAPVAFVAFLSPQSMLMMLPMFFIIVLASIPWVQDYRYHYMAVPLAITFIAVVEGIAWMKAKHLRYMLVGAVFTASLFGYALWGVGPGSKNWNAGYWPRSADETYADVLFGRTIRNERWPKVQARRDGLAMIPGDASVSAMFNIVPHVSDRTQAYEWPNPWIPTNWGICNDNVDDPGTVEWIIVDRDLMGDVVQKNLLTQLLASEFVVRLERDNIVVAQRTVVPSQPFAPAVTSCEGQRR